MRACALGRIHPPVRIGNSEASHQKHPIESDLEPAVSTQAELVRNVAAQNLEERVDRIVVHDGNLFRFAGVMSSVRGFSRAGYEPDAIARILTSSRSRTVVIRIGVTS